MTNILRQTLNGTLALGILVVPLCEATAFNMFDESSNCSATNCQSIRINGTVLADNIDPPSSLPWVAQVFATSGECVRLQVARQEQDLTMTVVSPDGQIWFDDDSGGNGRPLVKIQEAPVDGWYTVQLSPLFGDPLQADFTLRYGRYFGAGSRNCANPTSQLVASEAFATQSLAPPKFGNGASGPPFQAGSPGR